MASEPGFVPTAVNVEIEGDITVPGAPDEDEGPSTLDEPVSATLVSCSSELFHSFLEILCVQDLVRSCSCSFCHSQINICSRFCFMFRSEI